MSKLKPGIDWELMSISIGSHLKRGEILKRTSSYPQWRLGPWSHCSKGDLMANQKSPT